MTELTYTQIGDYLIPNITVPEQERLEVPLGKYGRMRKRYLQEHRRITWNELLLTGKLFTHLREIDAAAENRLEELMPKLAKEAGATEELKATDQMKWVGIMNNCKAQAEEIILNELIYV